jgi:hypothetical protein
MIRKQMVADRFKKAASAASAFKPRAGGAAEKILKQKAERDGEPDGITGVVPRPMPRQEPKPESPAAVAPPVKEVVPEPPPVLDVTPVTTPNEPATAAAPRTIEFAEDPQRLQPPTPQHEEVPEAANAAEEKIEQRQLRQAQLKVKRRSAYQEKNLAALEIDSKLLDGQGIDFEVMLSDFGWTTNILRPQQLIDLERDIRRELGRVEAGSWLSQADSAREERVTHVENLLDKAIEECDELEGLLTLYSVELSSLNDDIAFIEAQSQGLQVQSANQKLLQSELQSLVDTMSLDRRTLDPLQHLPLSDVTMLEKIEYCVTRLYQAMLTIDPTLHSNATARPGSRSTFGDNETSNMVALREKKGIYERECAKFSQRLLDCLEAKFAASFNAAKPRLMRAPSRAGSARLDENAFTDARAGLWTYSPLILFMKEINQPIWLRSLQAYQSRAKPLYSESFRENISDWKRAARAPSGDETEILFTHQEKEDLPTGGGITSTAKRITVKRSHTLAKTFRGATGDKNAPAIDRQPGAIIRAAAFAGAIDEMAPLISKEQNFLVDLFHATSLENGDFTDAVRAALPTQRHGTNLLERKPTDPDRVMADTVTGTINDIYSPFANDLSSMLDWAVSEDPLQGVGIMASLSKHTFYLQDSSQEYLLKLVDSLFTRLQSRFGKFVEEQIRAIEDTKVKIKKRKGVISFMKIFPLFSAAVETCFATIAGRDYDGPHDCVVEVRRLVDDAYERINRAMFDSLKAIAKQNPTGAGLVIAAAPAPSTSMASSAMQQVRAAALPGDDTEDKEMLNYEVLMIENMNHYAEEVDEGAREGVLASWKARALMERAEALKGYIERVAKRPLGKILVSCLSLSHACPSPRSQLSITNDAIHRISSSPPIPSAMQVTPASPRDRPTTGNPSAISSPSTKPRKSVAESTRYVSGSRSISATATKRLWRVVLLRW